MTLAAVWRVDGRPEWKQGPRSRPGLARGRRARPMIEAGCGGLHFTFGVDKIVTWFKIQRYKRV